MRSPETVPRSPIPNFSNMVRRILVTGANKGIGFAVVHRCLLDHTDTHLILACRSLQRGEDAVASISASQPEFRTRLSVLQLDTSSDDSVKVAASRLLATFGRDPRPLFGIVNNAGIASGSLSHLFQTNVYGPRRVDAAFLPLLDARAGRIVQMSSGAASMCVQACSAERQTFFVNAKVTWDEIVGVMRECENLPNGAQDLDGAGLGSTMGGYGLSKARIHVALCHRAAPRRAV